MKKLRNELCTIDNESEREKEKEEVRGINVTETEN